MTDDSIEKLARKLAESLPQGLRSVRDDLERNFLAVLRSGLGKLDLVTREEFDACTHAGKIAGAGSSPR
jgi:BMFP domain-containing protein YqiC